MARSPEVFVRPVTMTEGRRLQRIGRTAKDPVKLRRAIVVLMSAQGQSAPDIAHLLDCSPEYVRGVIRAFNESGFAALDPKWSGGRPRKISEQVRREICLLARCCPRDLGLAFSTWSLAKLAEYLAGAGIARISRESIRQILHEAGISWLATKTWKASPDPDFMRPRPPSWSARPAGRPHRSASAPVRACSVSSRSRCSSAADSSARSWLSPFVTSVTGVSLLVPGFAEYRPEAEYCLVVGGFAQ